jgi:hypothetical protein
MQAAYSEVQRRISANDHSEIDKMLEPGRKSADEMQKAVQKMQENPRTMLRQ